MPKRRRNRDPADVINIVRDIDELDEITIRWDENDDPVVKATYLVPDPDGTLRRDTRLSTISPTGFITSVFNSTT